MSSGSGDKQVCIDETFSRNPDMKSSTSKVITEEMIEIALKGMEDAINDFPGSGKSSYLKALQQAPHLVEKESNPVHFLLREDLNVWNAAERRVKYWEWREKLFKERAFLPLDLSGEGALDDKAVALSKVGATAILPSDNMGRPVVLFDRSRMKFKPQECTPTEVIRFAFYVLQIVSTSEIVLLDLVRDAVDPSSESTQMFFKMVAEAFPFRSGPAHLLFCMPKTWTRTLVESVITLIRNRYAMNVRSIGSPEFHWFVGDVPDEFRQHLCLHGMNADGLPESLGGTWLYENFTRSLRQYQTGLSKKSALAGSIEDISPDHNVSCEVQMHDNLQHESGVDDDQLLLSVFQAEGSNLHRGPSAVTATAKPTETASQGGEENSPLSLFKKNGYKSC